jgi:uncharacterized protein YciI
MRADGVNASEMNYHRRARTRARVAWRTPDRHPSTRRQGMLWVISCSDKPNTAATRAGILQPHRDYLQSQKKILVLAGATQNDDGTEALGSLFVVNVNGRAEAKAFSDGDPFTKAGVFASITITRMRKGQWNPEAAEGA